MDQFGISLHLEQIMKAREEWRSAYTSFVADTELLMGRLLHEAAVARMSVEQFAKASGLTVKRVRVLMREQGIDPKKGKALLAKESAEALQNNAALMGIEPAQVDLTSPLAYLPMGSELKAALEGVSGNADEAKVERLAEVFKAAWHECGVEGERTKAGIRAVLEALR